MSADRFERQVPELLIELSLPRVPDYFDDILRQTARTRQRPAWSFPERWIPMDITAPVPLGTRTVPWRTLAVVALLVIALAASIAIYLGSQRRPAPLLGPAANGSIVYDRDGDIYLADADGRGERLIIGGPANDFSPRFSNDGMTLYFGRETPGGTAVMAANPDGGWARQAARNPIGLSTGTVELSPDGARLLVVNEAPAIRTLEILDLTRGGESTVLDTPGIIPLYYAAWRPSTDEVVFRGYRATDSTVRGLYAIRADGTGLQTLFEVRDAGDGVFNEVMLSDDGRLATYWNFDADTGAGASCTVHVTDLTSGIDRALEYDPTAACEFRPAFASNGQLLLERQDVPNGRAQLMVAPADGSGPGRLIGPVWGEGEGNSWILSPDRRLVLLSLAEESLLISIETGSATPLEIRPDPMRWQRLGS